ncbi:hypothetical protein CL617_00380 [archaeon]|nr:hypothetical protein [archaeon]|tara:strand:+ start:4831 stop:5025 length:195 start_codon:yes stop_codon:yes gene_type:complete
MEQSKLILKKLDDIKSEIHEMKGQMIDIDTVLTQDDIESIEKAEKELKEGKTISHEKLKKELRL